MPLGEKGRKMATVERLDPVTTPVDEDDKASVANSAIFMLQTVQQHHVTLSQMADQKANIVIGAASVVFALVVSKGSLTALPVSLIILALSAFGAAGLCIFAVMPSIGRPPKTTNPNLLFFGAFSQLTEPEWRDQMVEVMQVQRQWHPRCDAPRYPPDGLRPEGHQVQVPRPWLPRVHLWAGGDADRVQSVEQVVAR